MAKRAKQAHFSDSEHSESDGGSSSNSSEGKPLSKESSVAKLAMKKQPKMIDTIIDALANFDDRKGATPIYIKKFILGKYPEMDTQLFKARFKRTFMKAIENHVLHSASEGEMEDRASESEEESAAITSKKSRDAETNPVRGTTSKMTSGEQQPAKVVGRRRAVNAVENSNIAGIESETEPARPRPRPARRGRK
ncbi:hypothetical protein HPB49_007246 [Dermacentor silvarum]|uniref:Uncharacterized protein n=1 Tax=Dermacentor silvarum TaxID=543639 RepID=A0ACB8DX85_DERSI|nr:hypothetical protein HPB49_007246 [Dermacentor silvarum]